jgi:hypothetical protein
MMKTGRRIAGVFAYCRDAAFTMARPRELSGSRHRSIFTCIAPILLPSREDLVVGNARVVLIVAALFAVLLSAFAAERLQVCHGDRRCLGQASLLPVARSFMAHPAAKTTAAPTPRPIDQEADASPRP